MNEYLLLFSNFGKIQVNVKFEDDGGFITSMKMNPIEITKLISPINGQFFSEMTFDDYPFEVYKYKINPLKKTLTIHVRPLKEDSKKRQVPDDLPQHGQFQTVGLCATQH
ncbi:MAG: hypothetical protein RBR42_09850 [Desulfomicrobium sp.]|nr:hypothetical protein [Desulfomicrobium sp.]